METHKPQGRLQTANDNPFWEISK